MFPGVNGTTLAVTFAVFFLNLPFGFWRAGVRKFSLPWFLAVHAPIPLVVGLRLGSDWDGVSRHFRFWQAVSSPANGWVA